MDIKENDITKKKRVRSTTQQINILSDYMAAHPRLANNEFNGPQGKAQRDRQWESLRIMLKEHGPDKTTDQWEHTWRDLRRNARNIGARVKSAQRATGNIANVPELSPQVLKILGTIGPESAFGITGAEETGVEFENEADPIEMVELSYNHMEPLFPSTSSRSEHLSRTLGSELLSRVASGSESLSRATWSEPLSRALALGSQALSRATGSEPLSGALALGSQALPRATGSEPLSRALAFGSQALPRATASESVSGASGIRQVPGVIASGIRLVPRVTASGIRLVPRATASGVRLVPSATGSELLSRATEGEPEPRASGSEPFPRASGNEPEPRASGSDSFARASGSEPYPRAAGSEPFPRASGNEPEPRASGSDSFPRASGSEPYPRAAGSEPYPRAAGSEPYPRAAGSEPFPRASGSERVPGTSGSEPLPRARGRAPREEQATGRKPVQGRRQGLGTRAADFLQAELNTNNILNDVSRQLMDINNQLATSNTYNATRIRLAFRESKFMTSEEEPEFALLPPIPETSILKS